MRDLFQPSSEPARSLYAAFQAEAAKRAGRAPEEWMRAEKEAVHREAVYQAEKLGLRAPSLDEVASAEQYACGSVDYGATWVYGVVKAMRSAQ